MLLGKIVDGRIIVKSLSEWFPHTFFAEGTGPSHFSEHMEVINYIPYDRTTHKLVRIPYSVSENKVYGVKIMTLSEDDKKRLYENALRPYLLKKDFILKLFDLRLKDKYDSVTKSDALSERDILEIELSDTIADRKSVV